MGIAPYVPGESKPNALKLSANENPLGCSPRVKEALKSFANINRYPDGGARALKDKIIEKFPGFERNNVLCGSGSDEIIGLLISAFTREGDEVLYSEYGFLMYKIYAAAFGAESVSAKEVGLKTSVENILSAVTEKTKLVFIANPNNPTGSYLTEKELEELRAGLREDILLVVDGAYAEFLEVERSDYESGVNLARKYKNVIATRTFSKIHGLASLRIGYAFMAEELMDIMDRVRGPFNLNAVAQEMAIVALDDEEFVRRSIAHNKEQLEYLRAEFDNLGIKYYPTWANFILLDLLDKDSANKLVSFLKEEDVMVRRVGAYGLPDKVRVTVGTAEENKILIDKIKKYQGV